MAKQWTDEEVQEEIRAAVKMVAEDRERKRYLDLHERFGKQPNDKDDGKTPPPEKNKPDKGDKPTGKKSLWWGELDNE